MTVRIPPVRYESASAAQREALDEVKRALGKVPNLHATIGQAPRVLSALVGMQAALGKGALSARDRHLIDLHVSQLNGCPYCVSAHTVFAKVDGLADEVALTPGHVAVLLHRAKEDLRVCLGSAEAAAA